MSSSGLLKAEIMVMIVMIWEAYWELDDCVGNNRALIRATGVFCQIFSANAVIELVSCFN